VLTVLAGTIGLLVFISDVRAADGPGPTNVVPFVAPARPLAEVLSPEKWREVENSVDRALAWLATRQQSDGSFPSIAAGQPGVTSLCVLAFLSRGHQPGVGPYGRQLNRAIDFVIGCQMRDGMFSYEKPESTHIVWHASHTACYNHAIAGLMLGEVYGQVAGERANNVKEAIEKALQFTRHLQEIRPKPVADRGGWRYLYTSTISDSDLSVTAWQLMFLRSAKNAEFDVPQAWVDEAMGYVRRCWDQRTGGFAYALYGGGPYAGTRGTTGAGILSLSLGGQHQTPMAQAAGDWLLAHPFRRFGELVGPSDMFFYSTYYCSQAAAQLGGRYWERIYPQLAQVLVGAQASNGSWPPEIGLNSSIFGQSYSTAMAVLSLTPPYQLLPVYQR
jgi:hypothetical protein